MPSLSAKFVRFVIKLSGIQKAFLQDPMLYQKLRKNDVLKPSKRMIKGTSTRQFELLNSTVTELVTNVGKPSSYLLIACPGGAFVSGPHLTVWPTMATLARNTGVNVWVVDYPKAPEHQLPEVAANMDAIYAKALEEYGADRIFLIGDSAGGQLVLSLTQRLVAQGLPLPVHLIGVSPIVNMSMDNPAIEAIAPLDPILAKKGIESSNRMALGSESPQSAAVSPLLGSFDGFPSTTLFLAEQDILYPDGLLAAEKMKTEGVELDVIVGEEMVHDWPYLPFMKEAAVALAQIEEAIAERMTSL